MKHLRVIDQIGNPADFELEFVPRSRRNHSKIKPTLTLTTPKASNFTQDEDPPGSQARQIELERFGA